MSKVRNFAEIAPNIGFSEFDFYVFYRSTFEKSELGRMKQLNGNIHYQMFCDVIIDPTRPPANYKLLDDIMLELAGKLKIQQQQDILAEMWKPYMQNLDTMYTDATYYESEMRYPTDPKLLWEGIEKAYETMCELSARLGIHRPRTKFIDVQKANLTSREKGDSEIITKMYRQQKNHFQSKDCRESIPDRIDQRARLAVA